MKKLLGILVLGLLWSVNVHSDSISLAVDKNSLKGLKEFQLSSTIEEKCGVTKNDIETSIKYLIANSKIKLVESSPTLLAIQVQIMEDSVGCFGHSDFKILEWWDTQNSASQRITAPIIFYTDGTYRKGPPDSFSINIIRNVETMTKNFVVEWSKQNSD